MIVQALVAVIALAAICGAAVVPVEEADIHLTASDADTGNWTANMGEVEVNIEHEHGSGPNSNGTWTLSMARTSFDKEENQEVDKVLQEMVDIFKFNVEQTSTSTPVTDDSALLEEQREHSGDAMASSDLPNSIPVEEAAIKDSYAPDYQSYDYPNFIPRQVYPLPDMYRMFPPNSPPRQSGFAFPYTLPRQQIVIKPPSNTRYAQLPFNVLQDSPQDFDLDSEEIVTDPDNFEYFKGVGWFKLDNRPMSWASAREACSNVGAHLAVPDTLERVNVFLKLFQRHPEIPRTATLRAQVYVGVSDLSKNRVFTTVKGDLFNPEFPIWFTNEPNNDPPGEDCVTFHLEGKTRDVPCFYELPFFCEKDLPVVI